MKLPIVKETSERKCTFRAITLHYLFELSPYIILYNVYQEKLENY